MNYLAHLALSNYNSDHLVGNFITDLVKRDEVQMFSKEIQHGVTIHQHIDGYTDRHELVLEAKSLIDSRSRRYAGILLDLYFDHLLIEYWDALYSDPLDAFIDYVHGVLAEHEKFFPQRAKLFSQRLRSYEILSSYADIQGVRNALMGVDKRLKKPVGLHHFLDDLLDHKEHIDKLFVPFYKDLQHFVTSTF